MPDLPIASAATLNHTTIASGDLFPVLDISAASGSKGSKITFGELFNGVPLLGAANVFTGANTFASGTITTNQPAVNVTQTWNNAAVGFKAMFFNITTTAADYINTALMEFQRNGSTVFKMDHAGSMSWTGAGMFWDTNNFKAQLPTSGYFTINDDAKLYRDAAGVFGVRNSTNAQALRIYETFTDASNYARLSFITTAGAYTITPEAAGTGTLRTLNISGLPTSASGLPSGTLWNNLGIVNVA